MFKPRIENSIFTVCRSALRFLLQDVHDKMIPVN